MLFVEFIGFLWIFGIKIEVVIGKVVKFYVQFGVYYWVNNVFENEIVCVFGFLFLCKCKLGQVKKNKLIILFIEYLLNISIYFEQSVLCFCIFDLYVKKLRIELLKKYINCNVRVMKEECLNWCVVLVV